MGRRYDLIIFDWDGTLMDSVGRIVRCWQQAAEAMGLPEVAESAVRGIIGLSMSEAMTQLAPGLNEVEQTRFREQYRNLYADPTLAPTPVFDGVESLLTQLNEQGHKLAVATGKARHGLERAFGHSGIQHHFVGSRTACETASKPDPQMVLELCQEQGVTPARTLMVGDAWFDLEMGRRAGSESIGVSYGAGDTPHLMTAQPRAVIHHPLELLQWV
ncbi:HAD family hydrolase [Ferrimonas balearica]|uniref:HAD family hydrolase n=1 Tax=Ferrimonas balearica TaxID=44012 RepID=UPI001C99BCED|nr:HAD-IA family hydrolase [Ferrimonas balearica]MBY5991068.1 HAD-IA family hydrolase [Ferrimonas balearica]